MMYYWNGNWGGMFLAMLLNIAFWALLLGLLVWAASRFFTRRGEPTEPGPRGPSASEILRQRYARGEIDEATFERMRQRLSVSEAPYTANMQRADTTPDALTPEARR